MKKSIIIMGSLLLVALVAGSVFAWGHGKSRGMGFSYNQSCQGYGGQSGWNELSQEQRDKLTVLRQKFIDDTYEFRSAKFQKHQEIRLLMETSEPDRAKLSKLSEELSNLQKQVRDKQIDFQLAAKKIAPEFIMGAGAGFGKGNKFDRGCQKGRKSGCQNGGKSGGQSGCRGQGQGNGYSNNNN